MAGSPLTLARPTVNTAVADASTPSLATATTGVLLPDAAADATPEDTAKRLNREQRRALEGKGRSKLGVIDTGGKGQTRMGDYFRDAPTAAPPQRPPDTSFRT